MTEKKELTFNEQAEAVNYFTTLKSTYKEQRQDLEDLWDEALRVYRVDPGVGSIYKGKSKVTEPIIHSKVEAIVSRVMRILFSQNPFSRVESAKEDAGKNNIIDLWNKYMFELQIPRIKFKDEYRLFQRMKAIQGTAVAQITQEFEEKEFNMFDDEEDETVTIKDDTYFRTILLEEFYSDINKPDINESAGCIRSTTISWEELKANEQRTITTVEEKEVQGQDGQVVIVEEKTTEEEGFYFNLDMVEDLQNIGIITDEQREYLDVLNINNKEQKSLEKSLKTGSKSGVYRIDECYGKYDINGDGVSEEVICTILEGRILVRMQPTPFKHKKYVRPFIVGRYIQLPNLLYGLSKVIMGLDLYYQYCSVRAMVMDATTFSIFPMLYENSAANLIWDGKLKPYGRIKGDLSAGQALQPISMPNANTIGYQDAQFLANDIDKLWNMTPLQEGTSQTSEIPRTARATLAVISQSDLPLNDLIEQAAENEIKIFLEMLYERNLQFKDKDDLLSAWSEEEIESAQVDSMKDLSIEPSFRVLGNMELNNEVAHQQGYMQFLTFAMQVPPLAQRLNWKEIGQKLLESFGIKDDIGNQIWIPEEILQQAKQAQAEAEAKAQEEERLLIEQQKQDVKESYGDKVEIDTKSKIVTDTNKIVKQMEADMQEKAVEARVEQITGSKVN